jgi:hypothetical protein
MNTEIKVVNGDTVEEAILNARVACDSCLEKKRTIISCIPIVSKVLSRSSFKDYDERYSFVITSIDTTLDKFKPRKSFELIKIESLKKKTIKHTLVY